MDQLGRFWADTGLFFLMPLNSKTYSILNILFMYDNKCLIGSIEHLNISILKRRVIQLYTCLYYRIFSNENLDMSVSSSTVQMVEIDFWNLLLMKKRFKKSLNDPIWFGHMIQLGQKLRRCCWQILWTKCVNCMLKMLMSYGYSGNQYPLSLNITVKRQHRHEHRYLVTNIQKLSPKWVGNIANSLILFKTPSDNLWVNFGWYNILEWSRMSIQEHASLFTSVPKKINRSGMILFRTQFWKSSSFPPSTNELKWFKFI